MASNDDDARSGGSQEERYSAIGSALTMDQVMNLWEEERSRSFGEFRLLLQQQLNAVQGQIESFCHSISQTMQRQTDRIIEELQSMRMQSEGDQGRADPRRNEHLKSTNSGTTTFKPSKFDGTEDWESYFIQFSAVANKNCWDDDTKAVALGAALNGAARDVLADIGPSASYRTLVEALEVRFGHKRQEQLYMTLLLARTQLAKEDLATYHQAVKTLARKALPGSSAGSECMVVHLFVKGIRDSSLREKVAIAGPKSMTEAAEVALRLEAALLTSPVTVRSGEIVDEQFTDDRANRTTTTTQPLPNRRSYRDFRQPPTCWKCLQPGHLARWCPFLANQVPQTNNPTAGSSTPSLPYNRQHSHQAPNYEAPPPSTSKRHQGNGTSSE
ncbi:hypothetical protein GE061_010570 [Apolygus lucorum]|uniref:CCHC-type domain-containing protein n=1 Tax=Apolygus lucorum TaxID=248454 RepID=A0A8S9XUZ5_APOLU|nr:hypothetical protein GE061_010570 [Apolygus lucorum]